LPLEVTEGDNAAFTVAASGEEPLTYQWIKDGVDLAGETASLLTLFSVTPSDSGLYRVRVSNAGGDVLSDEVQLTVNRTTPYGDWLADNGMESTTDPDAEDPESGLTYNALFTMGATLEPSGEWIGLLTVGAPAGNGTAGKAEVEFNGVEGKTYTLWFTSSLSDPDWQSLEVLTATESGTAGFEVDVPVSSGFYYIQVE
jgi:hypothetical protein